MYLSRLILNPRSRQVQKELADPYQLHRTIMAAFPDVLPPDERVLFRVDLADGLPVLLCNHSIRPNGTASTRLASAAISGLPACRTQRSSKLLWR